MAEDNINYQWGSEMQTNAGRGEFSGDDFFQGDFSHGIIYQGEFSGMNIYMSDYSSVLLSVCL